MNRAPAHNPFEETVAPTKVQIGVMLLVTSVSAILAGVLAMWGGADASLLVSLPATALGILLVCWNSHWGLCYAAFAITPLGDVQREIANVTINLPEFLILGLVLKEGALYCVRRERSASPVPLVPLAILVGCLAVAVATGFSRGNGAIKVLQDFRQFTEFLVLFWLVCQRITSRRLAVHLATAYLAGATVIAVHGIVQQFVPIHISETQISSDLVLHNSVRSSSFYGATPLGGLMVLATGLAAGMAFAVGRMRYRILIIVSLILCLLAMIYTQTRGSWVGAAVAMGFILFWVRPSKKVTLGLLVAGALFLIAVGPTIITRLATLADPADDTSLMERAQYYATAAHIGRAHPILGLGWGCYYEIGEIIGAGRYVETPRPPDAEDATVHSAYLQIFVKSGAVGTFGFLVFLGVWSERVIRVFKSRPHPPEEAALFAGLTAGLVGYLVHSTFENFFQWPVMSQSFWLLMGLSFVSATALGGSQRFPRAAFVAVSSATIIFTAFTLSCLKLEGVHTDHYEKNVATAISNGDLEKALRFAKRATEVRYDDSNAKAVYAEALLLNGDTEKAMAQLDRAMAITQREDAPRYIHTGAPYYFAPARLIRGRMRYERGNLLGAANEFELARAYVDLDSDKFSDFHATLFATYAGIGCWSRALEFGVPDPATLDGENLVQLGYTAGDKGLWELLGATASRLLSDDGYQSDAYYLLGRMRLAMDQPDIARLHFAEATRNGHADAPFYLGLALSALKQPAAATEAFVSTPPESVYHPIALAHALEESQSAPPLNIAPMEIRQRLFNAISSMTPTGSENSGPTAFLASSSGNAYHNAVMPLTLLWGDLPGIPESLSPVTILRGNTGQWTCQLGDSDTVIQFQLADNHALNPVYMTRGRPGPLPGWINSVNEWFEVTDRYASKSVYAAHGQTALEVEGPNWIYSVPVVAGPAYGYLLTGAVSAAPGTSRIYGQSLDRTSYVLETKNLVESTGRDASDSASSYFPPMGEKRGVRFQLEVAGDVTAEFTDLRILSITPYNFAAEDGSDVAN